MQEAFTQSGLSLENGSTVFSFTDEDFLINCDHFLPDPIEILSNEKIEVYPFLKNIIRIWDLQILFINNLLRTY